MIATLLSKPLLFRHSISHFVTETFLTGATNLQQQMRMTSALCNHVLFLSKKPIIVVWRKLKKMSR